LLEGSTPEIPYSIAHGNHDAIGGTTKYNNYFGVPHFQGKSYYGGHYASNNNNNYQLFTVGGMDFIIIHLSYGAGGDTNILNWANALLQTHSMRRAIITSHDVMNIDGSFTAAGINIYNALKGNANLFLIVCGHNHNESIRQDSYNGHTIYSLLADYQDEANGGNGWLRLMEFQPSSNQIQVSIYSPYLNQSEIDADSEFRLQYDMCPFQHIETVQNVSSGTHPSVNWENRNENTMYEWFVAVSDGTHTVNGPVWTFTTDAPTPVRLVDFRATLTPQGIQLDWQSAQETDLLGFNLFRAEALDGPHVKINPHLTPGISPGQLWGNAYQYPDATAETGKRYYYWVEWVGINSSEQYGPVIGSFSPLSVWLPTVVK
jgi:hypothetical protein